MDGDSTGRLCWRVAYAQDHELAAIAEILGVADGRTRLEDVAVMAGRHPQALYARRQVGAALLACDMEGRVDWAACDGRDRPDLVGEHVEAAARAMGLPGDCAAALVRCAESREQQVVAWGGLQRECYPYRNGRGALLVATRLGG